MSVTGFNDSMSYYLDEFFKNLVSFDPSKHESIFSNKLEFFEQ